VSVVIVVTHKDRLPPQEVEKQVAQFHADVNAMYGGDVNSVGNYPKEDEHRIYPPLSAVVCMTRQMERQDVNELRSSVYWAALRISKSAGKFVVGGLVSCHTCRLIDCIDNGVYTSIRGVDNHLPACQMLIKFKLGK
jgi:hypothetical protein